ncbi:putative transcriptional regulator, probably of sugar phosphate metabolism protein [Stappia aggregata IAM 12614]|uniref:Putative transcriptional regulator, probably of sugar phosphate metabolism protein n=1 Tax=Roseibium aggregatum (strain ATCC 25650 / DSM 13394 / JCM 20685 / NBRC 16684 / NCIMB 2208 / IAM 12614 / B1) TaxID=384765 RepID=A0NQG5_ROSAI|nr:MurR/RpiR family transcriptional regulator [Roseibium aggregatum]EAV45023.1 putative transcriptional regulator, probably of sugar phosphate metabolism protein [Stappia aggregata IAM 12614] [Roseibium aggregatum IAM 12614]
MRDILSVLQQIEPDLSKSERILAALLRSNAEFIVNAGITDVAERAGVSPPTVTRFCRRLGCESFTAFKVQVAQVTFAGTRYLTANAASDAPADIADSLLAQFQEAAASTRDALGMETVLAAADAISTAKLLAAFGAGGTSSMISDEIQNRFFRLGLRTVSVTDHAMQLMQAATMRTGDVIIASSVSGRNLQMVRALEAAKTYGAVVIALTRPGRPVADLADITIAIDLPEGENILRPSTSRYAFLFVTDLLATLVAMRRGDEARENLRRVKYQLSNTRDLDDKEALGD